MKNLKIAKKLLITFGTIILMMCATVILAIVSLTSTKNNFETFYNIPYEITNRSMDMRRTIQSTAKNLGYATMTDDKEKTANYVQEAQNDLQSLREGTEFLYNNFRGDKSLIDDFDSTMKSVITERDQVFQYALENKNKEATDLYFEKVNPAFVKAQQILVKINGLAAENGTMNFEDANDSAKATTVILIIISIITLAVTILLATNLTKGLTTPIKEIEAAADQMAEGNLSVPLHYTSRDELGSLADSMRTMMERISYYMTQITKDMDQLASGDLNVKKKEEFLGDFKPVQSSIRTLITSLNDAFLQINQSADQVASGSDQVSSGAQALSQGATEQASSVEELAAVISEISQQVEKNAVNAQDASTRATDTGAQLIQSNQRMQEMIQAMKEITVSSNEIGKIIKTIEDIAFQTNILALNAAVEAARAGVAGKGFAVVADEVRSLASKSSEASKNTAALIESSLRSVEHGAKISDETAEALVAAVEGAKILTETIDQISQASSEQASSISQVTQGIDQISSVVQTNSATAEESAAASEELSGQAQMLKNLVGQFKLNYSATEGTPGGGQPVYSRAEQPVLSMGSDKY
ncbi:MAG: methyl-accepting chemotaxis protein [Clostridiales bacterium]|nr:methyl-accepting chemotaxis protein [Clostridiales bacterium]